MITAGCDIGSLTAKAVILNDKKILGSYVTKVLNKPEDSANKVMNIALEKAGVSENDIKYCIGTGYGKKKIPFVNESISEIACHGKGAKWLLPRVKTVIDIGGQDCKVTKLDENGDIINFATNDKCAAGTGRFLEVMSKLLNVELDDLGKLSENSNEALNFSSTCTVWVQQEVIHHINDEKPIEDIGAAVNLAMAGRMAILAKRLGVEKDVCMTGGVAKNSGVRKDLERLLQIKIKKIKVDPQIVGALGAAIFARENL